MFKKYPHLERFGTDEVEDIQFGECYVFPKIDGTNAQLWSEEGLLRAGSRNRTLSLDSDNAGFCAYAVSNQKIVKFLENNPQLRLFGEWLVPHSLRTYREEAWRKFYIFDVATVTRESGNDEQIYFMPYGEYKPLLEAAGLDYIPALCKITNGTLEQFEEMLEKNTFLIKDGEGFGEGIVIKNYAFKNKFHRTTWAKIIRNEFKETHAHAFRLAAITGQKLLEEEIAKEFVTKSLVEKEYEKIKLEDGWSSKLIPRLLNTVFHNIVTEETWNILKKYESPKIDFKMLRTYTYRVTKEVAPHLF